MLKSILGDPHFFRLGTLGDHQIKTALTMLKSCQNGEEDP